MNQKYLTFLVIVFMAMTIPGCAGVSQSHVDTVLELDKAKAQVYADVSGSFRNFLIAVKAAAPDGSVTASKCADALDYLTKKDGQFDQATRETIRAINAMQWLDDGDREKYMEDLFAIIAVIKREAPPPTP